MRFGGPNENNGRPVLRSLMVSPLWVLRASLCEGWTRSLKQEEDDSLLMASDQSAAQLIGPVDVADGDNGPTAAG